MDIEKKKVILQIVPSMDLGGAENGTFEVSTFMRKMGWNVMVASSGGSLVQRLVLNKIVHIKLPLNSKNPLTIFF